MSVNVWCIFTAEDESASGTAAPSLSNQTPPGTTVTKGQVTTTPSSLTETTQKSASDSQDSIDGESSNEKSLPDDSARLDQSDNHHTTTELDANMDAKNKTGTPVFYTKLASLWLLKKMKLTFLYIMMP